MGSDSHLPPRPDEAYWAGLFAQEALLFTEEAAAVDGPAMDERDGRQSLDWRQSGRPEAWIQAHRALVEDAVLEAVVIGCNAGGLLVLWEGLQGFVPASQLEGLADFHIESARRRALQQHLHQRLPLKIIELDANNNRFILTARAVDVAAADKKRLYHTLRVGDKIPGHVTNLTEFGAFVDIGGVEGLVHISELSWNRVEHPSDVVQPGDPVTVQVLKIEPERERIGLSIKRLRPDPWQDVEARYQVGQLVTGTVTNVTTYGAFVRLEEELEGLIHVSELANGVIMHPRSIVARGDTVTARVLEVNGARRRLALSLRQVGG